MIYLIRVLVLIFFAASYTFAEGARDEAESYAYKVINAYPHDKNAFTQGLSYDDGFFYESTGLSGASSLRRIEPSTGNILRQRKIEGEFFAEGMTIHQNRIIQLTWKSRKGFIYDKDSFELIGVFNYPFEGWGITHDGKYFILSDGSATLRFLNLNTFEEAYKLEVRDESGSAIFGLNELEYIEGKIYANIWKTDKVAVISPDSGRVCAWLDLSGLRQFNKGQIKIDVLNGIAYNNKTRHLYVTGKLWPNIFEIKLIGKNE
ncbi:MAG: glutamine cyclotransferase [Candidatus Omnitrophica bacterium CG11_big_fil_rev_8_21_14_0_20_42_13]|uniref:Glutamine cyclotransferase n=1 Tax=Candidatus Ghiorseimicrobium undicola TaxID=1974746 RepID=A0A2H0LXL9_9BACT|nr:MAG: glutamine cyclotransferase [Candidatus Omnitrophica bacterium CG11_big_fil_rev_8_21_14_0_20_42_13]